MPRRRKDDEVDLEELMKAAEEMGAEDVARALQESAKKEEQIENETQSQTVPRENEPPPQVDNLRAELDELRSQINQIYRQHEAFRAEVSEFVQMLPEIIRQTVQQVAPQRQEAPPGGNPSGPSQNPPQGQAPQGQASQAQEDQPTLNIPDQLAVEAAIREADLRLLEQLQSMSGIDKLILLSRNLSGAVALLQSLRGNSHEGQQNPLAGFEASLQIFNSMFGYMTKIFEMASEAVSKAQQIAIRSARITPEPHKPTRKPPEEEESEAEA